MREGNNHNFESLAAELEDTHAFRDAKLRRSFVLRLIGQLPLSSAESSWLRTGLQYADGTATESDLEKARVEAWNSLGKRSCDFRDPAVNRTRAVICGLFPDMPAHEALDQVVNVEEFFVGAGGDERQAIELLRTIWPRG